MNNIHYLVFGGGGTAGAAYGGALEQLALEPEFSMANVKGVAGSSAGAITALLIALNYTPAQINQKLTDMDFSQVEDGGLLLSKTGRMFTRYGQYKGDALSEMIKGFIKEKFPDADPAKVTFNDIKQFSGKDLYIVTTKNYLVNDKYKNKPKIFSVEKHGNTPVAMIVKTSASAPLYFERCRLRKVEKGRYELGTSEDHLYSDGGVHLNYPIEIFDHPRYMTEPSSHDQVVNPHVLGFALLDREDIVSAKKIQKKILRDNHPWEYFYGLISTTLFNSTLTSLEKTSNLKRTVQIDRCGVALSDFNVTNEKKDELKKSGISAVKDYFACWRQMKKDAAIPAEPASPRGTSDEKNAKSSILGALKIW